jgi:hypothetical protein
MLIAALVGLGLAVGSWRALGPKRVPRGAREEREERERREGNSPPELGRARFMALAGVLVSGLFASGLVLFGVSAFLVNACSQAR